MAKAISQPKKAEKDIHIDTSGLLLVGGGFPKNPSSRTTRENHDGPTPIFRFISILITNTKDLIK